MILTNNIRKLRRILQGKGINLRETIADADAYSAVSVPNLRADDIIVSVLDMQDLVDVGAQINLAVAASREYGSSNARITFTAREAGAKGNLIKVAYVNDQVQSDAGFAQPIKVTVDNNADGTVTINVHLALNTSGMVDTTTPSGPNSANAVREAVLQQADAPGHPRAADLVDVTIANGSGVSYVGTMSATALQNGADASQHGATPNTLTDAEGLVWTERFPQSDDPDGRVISIQYVDPGMANATSYLTVTVTAANKVLIQIHLDTDVNAVITTTRNQVEQLVEDSYRQLTSNVGDSGVAGGPLGPTDYVKVAYPNDGTVVAAHAAADLTGGSTNGGFSLATSPHNSSSHALKIMWVSSHNL